MVGTTWKISGVAVQLNVNRSYYSWKSGTQMYEL
jgi:hypothetical protein